MNVNILFSIQLSEREAGPGCQMYAGLSRVLASPSAAIAHPKLVQDIRFEPTVCYIKSLY